MAENLPIVMGPEGPVPRSLIEIRGALLASVAAVNPGYTAELPGIMIEDISSTDTYAIAQSDSARVETVNSLTPLGANDFLLLQLGQQLGIPVGAVSNTSVFVVFNSNGVPGVVIGKGFIVTDGTYQYALNAGGITKSDGFTDPLFAIAILPGTWAVPPNSVVAIVTSAPPDITLTVTNPQSGIPGSDAGLTESDYRMRVLQANLAASQGMPRYLRTLVGNVPNVQSRLISAVMNPIGTVGKWEIIVGGGDPYQVAYGIYQALFDISNIVGSTLDISGISSALPAVVTTRLTHELVEGSLINITGVDPSGFDGDYRVYDVLSDWTFSLGKDYPLVSIASASWLAGDVTYVTTSPHGVTVGSTFTITGMTPAAYNGTFVAIAGTTGSDLVAVMAVDPGPATVMGALQPGIARFDSTALTWISGGIITPNPRNLLVSIQDFPDTYTFPIVIPPQQDVAIAISWNTISPNFVDPVAVAQTVQQPITDYVNSIIVGRPISLLELRRVFTESVVDILAIELISVLTIDVSINGVGTAPTGQLVYGDPESFFFTTTSDITVVKL